MPTANTEKLEAASLAQSEICRAMLAPTTTEVALEHAVRALVKATKARAVGVFLTVASDPDGELHLVSGTGWQPHVVPQVVPALQTGEGTIDLADVPLLANSRLLTVHQLGAGLLAAFDLPGGRGIVGVFGQQGDDVWDDVDRDLVAVAADRLARASVVVTSKTRLAPATSKC
ncbi:MAG: hypothetical protein ACR2H3_06850 [Acidimicrobiales bacterium]